MPKYRITAPDGSQYDVTGDGTQEEALSHFQEQYSQQQQAQPQQPSALPHFIRNQGLGARYVAEGLGGILTGPSDLLGGALNYGMGKIGIPYRFGSSGQALSEGLSKAGLPSPQTEGEQTVAKFGRAISAVPAYIATGGALAGSASPIVAGVGQTLASNPVMQAASAASGTAGSELARRSGFGPVGQIIGGLAGSAVPPLVSAGIPAATRYLFRGGDEGRQNVQNNIRTFQAAGTEPTVGQATEGRANRAAETLLSRSPGGAGPMAARASDQADEVAAQLEQQAQQLVGQSTSAEQTGRAITTSVRGDGGFVDQFKKTQTQLYDKLDQFIPSSDFVRIDKTQATLRSLNAEIPGAPNTSKFFQNGTIKAIDNALTSDLQQDGTLPYEALKKIRTLVGSEIADSGLTSSVPRSKWKALYGALSEDLGTAVEDNPQAKAAWTRANNYTRAGMQRIDALNSVLDRIGGPEAVFKAATAGTKEGASTLRSVMQSLDEDSQKMVTATVLRRLGLAKAGVQNELGDQFSSESFLTNWNSLSPEAKTTLFSRYGNQFRADMDQVAKFAGNLREGSQVFRNPSGTAQGLTQATTVGAGVMAALTGNFGVAGAIAAGMTGANLMARLMTNPRFVHWLAQTTAVPAGAAPAAINQLIQQARASKDSDLAQAAIMLDPKQQINVPVQ